MEPDSAVLAQLVTLAGVLAATIEYYEISKRREVCRHRALEGDLAAEARLHGMVRIFQPEHQTRPCGTEAVGLGAEEDPKSRTSSVRPHRQTPRPHEFVRDARHELVDDVAERLEGALQRFFRQPT